MGRLKATLASRNPNKARELERLLPGWTIAPLETDDYPPETGETYYDNARLKASFGRAHEWAGVPMIPTHRMRMASVAALTRRAKS